MDFQPGAYFDFQETDHSELFEDVIDVWEALPKIKDYVVEKVAGVPLDERIQGQIHPTAQVGTDVVIGPGTVVEAYAVIKGPALIGSDSTIRSGAYLRENLIIGNKCTLGNSSEFKNCVLFNRCEVPHFNYVGDSILGYRAHLGAGVICSNVRLDRKDVKLRLRGGDKLNTGLRKFGAIIGDYTEVGCNSALSPGSILGPHSIIYPLTSWTGILAANKVVKNRALIEIVGRD